MKKSLLLLLLIFVSHALFADVEYEWEDYYLAFTLPNDFEVVQNDGEAFYAEGDAMEFGLFPFADPDLDTSDIAYFTLAIAELVELDDVDEVELVELNGLEGAFVEGQKNGIRLILLGLIDPESDTNFFATIEFYDDDDIAVDAAVEIIESIYPY
ncbi:MAG: hypothetical protein MI748_09220 [Opitutales bacterium]|nr:hypothetical protein [Opitutales bacterium]